jgi:hypothetical protein
MKEKKSIESDLAGQEHSQAGLEENSNGMRPAGPIPLRAASAEQKPLRPEATMHMEVQARKSRGRLNRETMNRLGKTLEAYYDDVRKEGVPDRFKDLLEQLEARQDKGTGG